MPRVDQLTAEAYAIVNAKKVVISADATSARIRSVFMGLSLSRDQFHVQVQSTEGTWNAYFRGQARYFN